MCICNHSLRHSITPIRHYNKCTNVHMQSLNLYTCTNVHMYTSNYSLQLMYTCSDSLRTNAHTYNCTHVHMQLLTPIHIHMQCPTPSLNHQHAIRCNDSLRHSITHARARTLSLSSPPPRPHIPHTPKTSRSYYGVATSSSLLKIIGLFCKRALQKRRYSTKETYNFKELLWGGYK